MSNEITTTKEEREAAALAIREERLAMMKASPAAMKFEITQRQASMYASSTMVPKEYQKNQANCAIALNIAERLQADVFAVMQSMDVIHGRPSWRSSFLIAMVNASGRFSPLEFVIDGDGDQMSCYAQATVLATGKTVKGPTVTMEMAKAEGWLSKVGSKWKTMPQVMIQYRAGSFFAKIYAPDVTLGMQTREEVEDIGPKPGFKNARQVIEDDLAEDPFTHALDAKTEEVATDATTEEEPQKEGELL